MTRRPSTSRPLAYPLSIATLSILGVPWYWHHLGVDPRALLGGMPAWAMVALLCSVGISLLSARMVLIPQDRQRNA